MSLTGHIGDRGSSVRAFFARELGDTGERARAANTALRREREHPVGRPDAVPHLVGTAIDVLINAWLDPAAVPARQASAPTLESADLQLGSQLAL